MIDSDAEVVIQDASGFQSGMNEFIMHIDAMDELEDLEKRMNVWLTYS
jgi:soluble cytochrome b562